MSHEARDATADVLDQMAREFIRRDLALHYTDDDALDGRGIRVRGAPLINFGSCSYMGFETHPALKQAAADAALRYGTQFSSSRAFISLGLYRELEALLAQIFRKPLMVSASTTLGHMAAIPAIVGDDDAVVLDLQVHHSVQTAAQLVKARGVPIHIVRHNDMDQLERKIRRLQGRHRRVWYMADGVYSMFGDVAPMQRLVELMDRYPSLYCYVDDAHGMSWAGESGCGTVLDAVDHHDKLVLAVSLNKAFAAAGGCIVFPDQELADRARNTGGTMIFSGPIQPPMLGAAIAAAKLHLSEQMPAMQAELMALVDHCNTRIAALGLPQYAVTRSPLFFIPTGLPRVVGNLVKRLIADGFYVNMATFPATPMRQGGLRFMLNRNLTIADIDALLERVAYHYPLALAEEGSSLAEVRRAFDLAEVPLTAPPTAPAPVLSVSHHRTVDALSPAEWDGLFAGRGNMTHGAQQLLEEVFTVEDAPENVWDFHYAVVRDAAGAVVLAAPFTVALIKDDMTAPAAVSRQVEALRADEPYYLTSRAVMLGSLISKGDHLYVDRQHPAWTDAVDALLGLMEQVRAESGANQIMLRDFVSDADPALRQHLLDQGYVQLGLGDSMQVAALDWADHDDYLRRLGSKYRYNVRKEILPFAEGFTVDFAGPQTAAEIDACYALYRQVFSRSFALNVFPLPRRFFAAMCRHPDFEVMRLSLAGASEPVGVMFSFVGQGYHALIVGLDERVRRSHGVYKQALYRTVMRARALGCSHLDLAYTAELEKKKVGARPVPTCAFVQATDHFNHMIIEAMSLDGSHR